ncbi:MAG: polymer-forming cytoskeletal protein [Sphingobacteriaceae bacterium]|nr:polymer-forming cytoskeletal protein [Sphingobacteriaceae bacterium]
MFKKNKKNLPLDLSQLEISTIVGADYVITGELNGTSVIRIDGKVIGDVKVEKGVVLGENGIIEGNLTTHLAIIFGKVNGNLKAHQLEIKKTGCVNGDIKTETLEIEMGAQYNGKLEMKQLVKREENQPVATPQQSNKK